MKSFKTFLLSLLLHQLVIRLQNIIMAFVRQSSYLIAIHVIYSIVQVSKPEYDAKKNTNAWYVGEPYLYSK